MDRTVGRLLASDEPSVRLKALTSLQGKSRRNLAVRQAEAALVASDRVRLLLAERGADGRIPHHPYAKWYGAHWVLAMLADIGYPPGDQSLVPLREQVYEWLLSRGHAQSMAVIEGRARRCASQEGNAIYALVTLGLDDDRTAQLVTNLLHWQWPDGGWNCDRKPDAAKSSFHETLLPLRGLAAYAARRGPAGVCEALDRAAEVFLRRGLFRRQSDGQVIATDFLELHYPAYWRYDILIALKVLAEAGHIADPRCQEALDLLLARRLSDGGWPADRRWYRVTQDSFATGRSSSRVGWGPGGKRQMNEFVTVDALYVLRMVGQVGS